MVCVNTQGSYACDCRTGLWKVGKSATCSDIDECFDNGDCGATATCINTYGSYECECNTGYYKYGGSSKCRPCRNGHYVDGSLCLVSSGCVRACVCKGVCL